MKGINQIHPTAVIDKSAVIGHQVVIHPFVVIEENVVVGDNTIISKGATLKKNVKVGTRNFIGENVVIGIDPCSIGFDCNQKSGVVIGNNNFLKEFVTIERATKVNGNTIIGDHNYLMIHAHIGHDNQVANHVVICNNSTAAGFVSIGDHTFISGGCYFHQFTRVGSYVMVGACSKVGGDIPPFVMVEGYIGRYRGVNVVGLKRAGFINEDRNLIKSLYTHFYEGLVSDGIKKIQDFPESKIRNHILDFLTAESKRKFVRKD